MLSSQLYHHQILALVQTAPRPTRCQEVKGPWKSLTTDCEIFPSGTLEPSKSSRPTVLRNTCTPNLTTQRPSAGARAAFWCQEILRRARRVVSLLHSPWCGMFLLDQKPSDIYIKKKKSLCWYQKGKYNWHRQLICSPPWIMVDELPPLLPWSINKTARKTAE